MSDWFRSWFNSPYYHQLYKNRSQEEADGFVSKCIHVLEVKKGQSLLELACGKGRHAKAFAEFGLDVCGVDLSEESILKAKEEEHDHLHFFIHDMRRLFRYNYFDYITNMFTSFGYFKSEKDNERVAQAIYDGLKTGGKFLMDFVNQQYVFDVVRQHPSAEIEADSLVFHIHKRIEEERVIKNIRFHDQGKDYEFEEILATFSFQKMKSLFEATGLGFVKAYGDYDLNEYDEIHSPRMILLFQKNEDESGPSH